MDDAWKIQAPDGVLFEIETGVPVRVSRIVNGEASNFGTFSSLTSAFWAILSMYEPPEEAA